MSENEGPSAENDAPLLEAVKGLSDDLAKMLGIRYDDPIAVAAAVVTSGYFADRLAQAWAEGKHSEHTPACRLGDGDCICPNPYRVIPPGKRDDQ